MVVPTAFRVGSNSDEGHPAFDQSPSQQNVLSERIAAVAVASLHRFRFDVEGRSRRIAGDHVKGLPSEIVGRFGGTAVIDDPFCRIETAQKSPSIGEPVRRQSVEQRQIWNMEVLRVGTLSRFKRVESFSQPRGSAKPHEPGNRDERRYAFRIRPPQPGRDGPDAGHFVVADLTIAEVVATLRHVTAGPVTA